MLPPPSCSLPKARLTFKPTGLRSSTLLRRRISEVAAEVLRAIVHQRYKLRRAIVITSNRVVKD